MQVTKRDGRKEDVKLEKIVKRIQVQAKGLKNVDVMSIAPKVIAGLYDNVSTKELDSLAIKTAASLATFHYEYDTLAARLNISVLHKETKGSFSEVMEDLYSRIDSFGRARPAVSEDFIKIVRKHRAVLDSSIVYSRDYNFDYLGIETLRKSYLQRIKSKIVERPQHMWMRVAVGIHGKDINAAIDTYEKMSQKLFTHATPTLFNAGTLKPQLASCFLVHMDDDSIVGIFKTLSDCAKISQMAGGIGIHHHEIRAAGSPIYGTNGTSNGLVPMLRVYNSMAAYVDQGGGKRKGAVASYLELWHADIFEWLDLKKNNGKEEIRARDLFYGAWVPDLFMKRVAEDAGWTLFDPHLSPGLSDCWGDRFEELYLQYEDENKGVRKVKAQELWRKIIEVQIETSMPYILYKDACNRKSNQQNLGTIKSSNLCAEILEHTSRDEIAVCNLGSISLPSFVEGQTKLKFNHKKLCEVVKTAIVNLNRVIDINHYPLPEAEKSNLRHRPIGLGVQGLADVFMLMRYSWDSAEAFTLNREIFESIYFAALEASVEEAQKYGAYETFAGSPASEGRLQFDLWFEERLLRGETLKEQSGEELYCTSKRYNWKELKQKIKQYGLRNSLLLANMPTASTSNILGNTEGFEPIPSNIYKRNVLSGEFIRINKYLIDDLQELGLWDETMKQKIIAGEGSIQHIAEIPTDIRNLYRTVWEIKQRYIIDLAADRGAFICQSQSLNIFMANPTIDTLSSMHFYGWKKGLKTGSYYIRQQAARQAQKFTVDVAIERQVASDSYQKALEVLKARGFTDEEISAISKEDAISTAQIMDDPESCIMCSG